MGVLTAKELQGRSNTVPILKKDKITQKEETHEVVNVHYFLHPEGYDIQGSYKIGTRILAIRDGVIKTNRRSEIDELKRVFKVWGEEELT